MKNFHFETPQHKTLECETFVRSMQNLKHQGDFGGTIRLRCLEPLFVGIKKFMKATMRGDAFFIYALPSLDVEPHPHENSFLIPKIQGCV
jgi:hypothetical protein